MKPRNIALCVAAVAAAAALADERDRPVRQAQSENGLYQLRVEPGRPGRPGRPCYARLTREGADAHSGVVWERALVNDVAPMLAAVRNDGQFLVTLDEFGRGGARHALVIYGAGGELLRHFLLIDLLDKPDWSHVKVERQKIAWTTNAKPRFVDERDEFEIEFAWGRKVRIDLTLLRVVRESGTGAQAMREVPPDALAVVFGMIPDEASRVIAERLSELAASQPGVSPPTTAEAQEPRADRIEPVAAPAAAGEPPAAEATAVTLEPPPEAMAQAMPDAGGLTEPAPLEPGDEAEPAPRFAAVVDEIAVPMPNPYEHVDYVAWVNALGEVDGPDARPLYDRARELLVPWEGDEPLWTAAERGDPDALLAPEISEWLAANADALDSFREAALTDASSWHYESQDGSMIAVLLPSLSTTRQLAKTAVLAGRREAALNRPADAAEYYLDVLSAGAHTGQELTLISNLVGVAMQALAANAVLDLASQASGEELDYAWLSEELEREYRPTRSMAQTIQAERAFYLDTVQRLWKPDRTTGALAFDRDAARSLFEAVGESSGEVDAFADAIEAAGYDAVLSEGNRYYDELTGATSLPYPDAKPRIAAIERQLEQDGASPVMRHLLPALSRYTFIRTRAETTRRATLLVAKLKAYASEFGHYPDSLDAFGDREFALDPFGTARFVYRRTGDDFELYSIADDGVDDGGRHDRRGEHGDLRFWPPPARE